MTETIRARAQAETQTLANGRVRLRLYGSLDVHTMGELWRELEARLQPVQALAVDVDATDLDVRGGGGLALLRYLKVGGFTPHAVVTLRGLNPELNEILHLYAGQNLQPQQAGHRRPPSVLQEIGTAVRDFARDMREQVAFVGTMAGELAGAVFHHERLRWKEVKRLCIAAGANALPIVSLLSFLIGLILGFEGSKPLAQFGAQIFIADMVGFASVREMGPIMTAILLAGRSGAAFAAEIGSMKIDEELSALSIMGLNPMRFLALQRVAAGILLTPLLTVYTMLTGVLGGTLVLLALGFSFQAIYHEMATSVHLEDIGIGLGKSAVFGIIFSAVGCLRGFQTGQGPIAVGVSATRAVVSSIFLIIFADTVFAGAAFFLNQ